MQDYIHKHPINYPKVIILDTSASLIRFKNRLMDLELTDHDVEEIGHQILERLLYMDMSGTVRSLPDMPFPAINRFTINTEDTNNMTRFCEESNILMNDIYNKLDSYNAYTNEGFPYIFSHYIANDMVLKNLLF